MGRHSRRRSTPASRCRTSRGRWVALAEVDEPLEPGLERAVERADVGAPQAVALLEAERIEGPVADVNQPERLAGSEEQVVQHPRQFLDPVVELQPSSPV